MTNPIVVTRFSSLRMSVCWSVGNACATTFFVWSRVVQTILSDTNSSYQNCKTQMRLFLLLCLNNFPSMTWFPPHKNKEIIYQVKMQRNSLLPLHALPSSDNKREIMSRLQGFLKLADQGCHIVCLLSDEANLNVSST